MEMIISKEQAVAFVKAYYQKVEQKDVEVYFEAKKILGIHEVYDCQTVLNINYKENIFDVEIPVKEQVQEDCLLEIFQTILKDYDYTVESARFEDGLNKEYRGVYMNEHLVEEPYCNGINLVVKKQVKQKVIGKKEG